MSTEDFSGHVLVFGQLGWGWFLAIVVVMGLLAAAIAAVLLRPNHSPVSSD